jgi:hypothetical protein
MPAAVADSLGVLGSCRAVAEGSRYVRVDEAAVASLAPGLARRVSPPSWQERYHWRDRTEKGANWLLVLDGLNFSFWGEPRWRIEHEGQTLDGYVALAAALTRAVEAGRPLWDASYLSRLSMDELGEILAGQDGVTIPLLDRRLEHLHEIGEVLLARYDGWFSRAIESCGGSAARLVRLLASDFLSFDDIADFKGQAVRFYKRAQLLVSDLYGAFGGDRWGRFGDLEQLTVFADYKLPQLLRHWGILSYLPSLAEKVDNRFLLPPLSREEVEIRANTVWAGELLRRDLARQGADLRAFELDWWLWNESQSFPGMAPYHVCRTIYY